MKTEVQIKLGIFLIPLSTLICCLVAYAVGIGEGVNSQKVDQTEAYYAYVTTTPELAGEDLDADSIRQIHTFIVMLSAEGDTIQTVDHFDNVGIFVNGYYYDFLKW